jgi:hypothetical protein
MPTNIKIILTLLVALTAVGAHYYQAAIGQPITPWVVLGLGVFMIIALWLFPDAKGKHERR